MTTKYKVDAAVGSMNSAPMDVFGGEPAISRLLHPSPRDEPGQRTTVKQHRSLKNYR
jgi:hypothetical protein